MLVAVQFDKKIEHTIKDLVLSSKPDFKLFFSGSLEVIAELLKEKCSICKKELSAEDSKDNESVWILFILNSANPILSSTLLETCSINLKTFKSVREFFDSSLLCCKNCHVKDLRTDSPKAKRARIELSEAKEVKQEQQGRNVKEKDVAVLPNSDQTSTPNARYVRDNQVSLLPMNTTETIGNRESRKIDNVNILNDNGQALSTQNGPDPQKTDASDVDDGRNKIPESQLSDLDSDDSDFFIHRRKRSMFSKKSFQSNERLLSKSDPKQDMSTPKNTNGKEKSAPCKDNSVENPYNECSVCKKKLVTKWSLAAHMKVHTGERPFECNVCGKRYADKRSLSKHNNTHNE